jgi:copper chaperone
MSLSGFSMNEIVLSVTGMTCGGCVNSVNKVLTALPGVQSVEVSLTPGQARVVFDPTKVDRAAMVQAVVDAGFGVNA